MKHMRALTGRKRVRGDVIRGIGKEVFERDYVLIDQETNFVVLARGRFHSNRPVSEACVSARTIAASGVATACRATIRTHL